MNDLHAASDWGTYPPSPALRLFIDIARNERLRGAPQFLRRLARSIAYRAHQGPVDATAYGFRARFFPRDNLAEKRVLFSPQEWDMEERLALLKVFRRDFRFVDVGANAGFYSLFVAATAGTTARVLAIEPQPMMRSRLAFNIAANNMTRQINISGEAVSDRIGTAEFLISHSNRGTSGLNSAQGEAERIKVSTTTLPLIIQMQNWSRVDALKIDIEGAEDRALPPLFELAEHLWPRLILMETRAQNWQVDLPALLANKGYEQTSQTRGNGIWTRL